MQGEAWVGTLSSELHDLEILDAFIEHVCEFSILAAHMDVVFSTIACEARIPALVMPVTKSEDQSINAYQENLHDCTYDCD